MLVANFMNKNPQKKLDINTKIINNGIGTLEALGRSEQAGMSFEALRALKRDFGFTQMRINCVDNLKRLEIMTTDDEKGRAVVEYFTSDSNSRPDACGSFKAEGDSALEKDCTIWANGKWGKDGFYGNDRLYGIIAYSSARQLYVSMGARSRFSCGDNLYGTLLGFKLFVR